MKYTRLTILSLIVLAVFGVSSAMAQTGSLLNFTGKVTNLDGTEVADGAYDFVYRLYDTPSGGTALWTETLSASTRFVATVDSITTLATSTRIDYSVSSATSTLGVGQYLSTYGSSDAALITDYNSIGTYLFVASSSLVISAGDEISNKPFVEGGVIAENLGTVSDISDVDFLQTLYLEVEFNGEIMRPRKLLTRAASAFDTSRFGGKTESQYATLDENEIVTGEWSFNNILSIATGSATTALTVVQNGSGSLVEIKRGATTSFAVLNDGRVQFENYTFPLANGLPGYVLKATAGGQLEWAVDFAGGFGTEGKTLWATTSDELIIYPIDTSYVTVLGNNATSTLDGQIFEVQGSSLFDRVNISNQSELRFYDADNSNYMSLRASSTLTSNYVLILPRDAGTDGMSLVTDGNGNLRWEAGSQLIEQEIIDFGFIKGLTLGNLYDVSTSSLSINDVVYWTGVEWQTTATSTWDTNTGWTALTDMSLSNGYIYTGYLGSPIATSSIFIDVITKNVGIGTTTPDSLFHVDGDGTFDRLCIGGTCIDEWGSAGSLDSTAVSIGGVATWYDADTLTASTSINVAYGGTGKQSWTQYAIPYLTDSNTFGEITIGNSSYVLAVNGTQDGYTWIDASSTGATYQFNAEYSPAQSGIIQIYATSTAGNDFQIISNANIHTFYLPDASSSARGLLTGSDWSTFNNKWDDLADMTLDTGFVYVGYGNDPIATSTIYIDTGLNYVGIGTTTPDTLFHVDGAGSFSSLCINGDCKIDWASAGPIDGGGGADEIAFWSDSDTLSSISKGATNTVFYIDASGNYAWTATSTWIHDEVTLTGARNYITISDQNISVGEVDISDDTNLTVTATGIERLDDAIVLTDDYLIPRSGSTTNWNNFFDTPNTVITDGNNITWSGNTLNVTDIWWDNLDDMTLVSGNVYIGYGGIPVATSTVFIDTALNYVGIGTTTPNTIFHVDGRGTFDEICFGSDCQSDWASAGAFDGSGTDGEPAVWVDGNTLTSTSSINVAYGGTGRQTLSDGGVLLGAGSGPINILAVSNAGEIMIGDGVGGPTVLAAFTAEDGALKAQYGGIGTSSAVWNGVAVINNGIWSASSALSIAYGGTGANNASSARANLDLKSIYDYGINFVATSGYVWMSDGDGRGEWVATSSLGVGESGGGMNVSVFVGTTTVTYDGYFASSTYEGYEAANYICDAEYPGSHFCRTYDLLVTAEQQDVSGWGGEGWVAEGPPGFTSDSNDCNGWTDNDSAKYGAWWEYTPNGGMGWLIYCNFSKPISCCSRQ
ncbi:MAG: hypothetical protein U9Q85_01385 [Patescibacteria group bacterium]|nr:hypothetical protein [Patescibacteria group bacterium]